MSASLRVFDKQLFYIILSGLCLLNDYDTSIVMVGGMDTFLHEFYCLFIVIIISYLQLEYVLTLNLKKKKEIA